MKKGKVALCSTLSKIVLVSLLSKWSELFLSLHNGNNSDDNFYFDYSAVNLDNLQFYLYVYFMKK